MTRTPQTAARVVNRSLTALRRRLQVILFCYASICSFFKSPSLFQGFAEGVAELQEARVNFHKNDTYAASQNLANAVADLHIMLQGLRVQPNLGENRDLVQGLKDRLVLAERVASVKGHLLVRCI